MGFHHVAFATRDSAATHAFYTELMGFRLAKVMAAATPGNTGTSKHFFFETGSVAGDGSGMIAFWELNDPTMEGFRTDLSESLGLPVWVNHLAFDCPDDASFDAAKERWRSGGQAFVEVDHDFCRSIYLTDPNGIMVEFCQTTRPFTEAERTGAAELLADPAAPLEPVGAITVHRP
jgi:catechol 2,3-dioxygenase-like lactoylglutathione lyase family enzyme